MNDLLSGGLWGERRWKVNKNANSFHSRSRTLDAVVVVGGEV